MVTATGISEACIESIAAQLEATGIGEGAQAKLREDHAGIRFTFCMDDDIAVNARPVAERAQFNVYLVGSGSHCIALTADHASATGIVIAEKVVD